MMCITTLSLQTRPLIIYSNTLFCTNNRSPSRQSIICTSEEVRNILDGTILDHNFEETHKNSKVLWSSFRTYLFYWLWSTWSQSWWGIFNVHHRQGWGSAAAREHGVSGGVMVSSDFFHFCGWIILHWREYHILLFSYSVDTHLGGFHILLLCVVLLWTSYTSFYVDIGFHFGGVYLGVGLLGYMVSPCLILLGAFRLFSKAAATFYNPTCSVWRLHFLPILGNTCYCLTFWW